MAQESDLALEAFHAGGEGGQVCGDLSSLVWLPSLLLVVVRGHGNYFTSIAQRSGTGSRRLIVFVQEARQMPVQVLVVDDDALSREVLALLLHGAGYAVETADSGDAALLHLQTAQVAPQAVLTDLQMPGTTGNELALRLRALCGPATVLLAMSASAPSLRAVSPCMSPDPSRRPAILTAAIVRMDPMAMTLSHTPEIPTA